MSFNNSYNPPSEGIDPNAGDSRPQRHFQGLNPHNKEHPYGYNINPNPSRYDRRPQFDRSRPQPVYQPYVFKPNFLKNQEKDEEGNVIGQKRFGRKVIDWTAPSMRFIHRRKYQQFSHQSRPSFISSPGNGGCAIPPDEMYHWQLQKVQKIIESSQNFQCIIKF